MKLDYRNTKNGVSLIPNGWYSVEIQNVTIGNTKNNYEAWNLEMFVTGIPNG